MATHRSKACPGYDWGDTHHVDCGNTLYEKTWNDDDKRVWHCTNCGAETPRRMVHRRTNKAIGLAKYLKLKEAWKTTDEALKSLVDSGTPSGCLLVHTSTYNYNLGKLLGGKKLSRFDLSYHATEAKKDLEKAKQFVVEKGGTI